MLIKDVVQYLGEWAPQAYAESYDNVGLLVGNPLNKITGVLVSLDCTEAVVAEAVQKGCNLIVSHHPIIFKGIKSLTGANYVERTVMMAIKNDVSLYAIHTNLDSITSGVNHRIASLLGLMNLKILKPKIDILRKLTYYTPTADAEKVRLAVFEAGAGVIAHYSDCSFNIDGTGTYTPGAGSDPYEGKVGVPSIAAEVRTEVLLPAYLEGRVIDAMKRAHPYEEVAYYLSSLANENQYVGSGMVGELAGEVDELSFLEFTKKTMAAGVVKYTAFRNKPVKSVAICGGSGSFLLGDAISAGADVFITGDFKYHEFFDAESKIVIADIGHYESEQFTINLIAEKLSEKFSNFATRLTEVNTNPIHYL